MNIKLKQCARPKKTNKSTIVHTNTILLYNLVLMTKFYCKLKPYLEPETPF